MIRLLSIKFKITKIFCAEYFGFFKGLLIDELLLGRYPFFTLPLILLHLCLQKWSTKSLSLELAFLERYLARLDVQDLEALRLRMKAFSRPIANAAFLQKQAAAPHISEARLAALSILAYALWCPSWVEKFVRRGGDICLPTALKDIVPGAFLREEISFGTIFLNEDVDNRVVYDLSFLYPNATFVANQKKTDRITRYSYIKTLPKTVSFVGSRFELLANTPEDAACVLAARKYADLICQIFLNFFADRALLGILTKYRRAMALLLERGVYSQMQKSRVTMMNIISHNSDNILVIYGGKVAYVDVGFIKEKLPQSNVFSIRLGYPPNVRTPAGTKADLGASLSMLEGVFDHFNRPFFEAADDSVVVVSNFYSTDFRASQIGLKIIKSVAAKASCVAMQRSAFSVRTPHGRELLWAMERLLRRTPPGRLQLCLDGFNIDSEAFVSTKGAELARLSQAVWSELTRLAPEIEPDFQTFGGADFLRRGLDLLIYERLPYLVSVMAKAEATFSKNKIRSMMFNIGDRYMENYCLGIAARATGVATFQYNPLFISDSPKYVAPMSYYSMVADSAMVESYRDLLGLSTQQLLPVGSHMVDNRRTAVVGLDREVERQQLGIASDRKYVITFASQPSHGPTVRAVRALIEACRSLPVQILIKLHPSESLQKADIYKEIARDCGAETWVSVYPTGDLNKMMFASDLIVTLFSNVGLEAAVLGRNLLAIKLEEAAFPIDLEERGLAIGANSIEELNRVVPELLCGGPAAERSEELRRVFQERNPQFVSGSVEERIAHNLLDEELRMAAIRNIGSLDANEAA